MLKTIGMTYDGYPDDNPFVPKVGDAVACCPHEPRPLHAGFADMIQIDGVSVRWANLCRECGKNYLDTERAAMRVFIWTEADAERVKMASRL